MSTVTQFPPSQQDLHAYLDDELPPAQRARIKEWLWTHPDQRRQLLELKLRENLLRTAINRSRKDNASYAIGEEKEAYTDEPAPQPQRWKAFWILLGLLALLLTSTALFH